MENKIFEKANPANACIIDVSHYTTAEIRRLLEIQKMVGRTEIEFLQEGGE